MLSLSRLSVRRFSSECQQETQHSGNHVTLQREKKHMHVYIQTSMSPLPLTNQRWGRRAVCFFPSMLSSLFPPSQRAGPVSEGISDCCSCSPVCHFSRELRGLCAPGKPRCSPGAGTSYGGGSRGVLLIYPQPFHIWGSGNPKKPLNIWELFTTIKCSGNLSQLIRLKWLKIQSAAW